MREAHSKRSVYLFQAGLFACVLFYLSFVFFSKALSSELFFNGGDEGRYALNGLFYLEFLKSGAWFHPIQFLSGYYEQYPSLSIHLAQPLLPLMEAGSFALFGVSVLSAKLIVIVLGFFSVFLFYRLLNKCLDPWAAAICVILLVTSHPFLHYAVHLNSEMPGLFMVILISFLTFAHARWARLIAYSLVLAMPLLLNHKLLFLYPAYMTFFLSRHQMRTSKIIQSFILVFCVTFAIGFGVSSVRFPSMFETVFHSFFFRKIAGLDIQLWIENFIHYFQWIIKGLTPLGAVIFVSALVWLGAKRRLLSTLIFRYGLIIGSWNLLFFSVFGSFKEERFLVYSLPFAVVFIGWSLARLMTHKIWVIKLLGFGLSIYLVATNYSIFQKHAHFVVGYQKAVEYLVGINTRNAPVLFDGYQDGNFVFFVRSQDPKMKQRIHRSDRTIFISKFNLNPKTAKAIAQNDDEIYEILNKNGIRYIVSESLDFKIPIQQEFRSLLGTSPFFKKLKEFPILSDLGPDKVTGSPGYRNQKLTLYEYVPRSV